jgi:hypothetical protein
MGKPREALPYLQRSLPHQCQALNQRPGKIRFRELVGKTYGQIAIAHAMLGDFADADTALGERRRLWTSLQPEPLVDMAFDLGKCITQIAAGKEKLSEADTAAQRKYADLAMATLFEAVALGFRDSDRLRKEMKLAPLREREDFAQLLAAMQ